MDHRPSLPRGLVGRSVLAVGVFAVAVTPGWTLGALTARWTGVQALDWCVTYAWTGAVVWVLGPYASYRRRDVWLGVVPLLGWYLVCVVSWRVALLPYRDWEPRGDELWRARWLTGDLIGYWRTDRPPVVPRGARERPISRQTN